MIKAENVSKRYGRISACSNVSFELYPGDVTALAGTNGAGKSTLLSMLSGVLIPDSGKILAGTHDLLANPLEGRRIIGTLFEDAPLYGDMTVFSHICFAARLYGFSASDARDATENAIATCDLSGVRNRRIGALSRGYRQRTGLALALVHDPEILLLDEPTSGLDPVQLDQFRSIIASLPAKKTVLLSTHDMQEIESMCNKILVMKEGSLIFSGSLKDICAATKKDSVGKAFLSLVKPEGNAAS